MNKALRDIFGPLIKTHNDAGGRRFFSSHYMARGADGRQWKVERHAWSIPVASKGWRAECEGVRAIYADTLVELAHKLGHPREVIEPDAA